jgi:hypothetical protein
MRKSNKTYSYPRNINKLVRTLEKAADTIEDKTGWSMVILFGGPEPKRGGGIHVFG